MDPITTLVIAKPAANLATRLLKPVIDKLSNEISTHVQLAYHNLFNSYTKYLDDSYERHSYFNSVVFKNEQKRLADYYLPLTLIKPSINEQVLVSSYPINLIEETKKILIVDTAGMGKTTLLKYLFLGCVDNEAGIPIYVELRKLSKKKSLLDFIIEQLSDLKGQCKPELLFKLLESGKFVIFLDGYDEIPENERTEVTAGLQDFISKAPSNTYLMTSREEGGLVAFPQFQRFTIRPLLKEEAYTLLRKYADEKIAELLITKLELQENAAISEFLTNPLLTSLLYISFQYKHVVPLQRHIFYRQVFDALYESHDLTKEGGEYHRSKKCGLDIDRFEHILRSLGGLTYRKGKSEYTREELLAFIDDAKKLSSENKISSSSILHDLTHAVPLMVEEGNYIRWSHRSIQEYFAARSIYKDTKGNQTQILLNYLQRNDFASHLNLVTLCADIDRTSYRQSIAKWLANTLLDEFNSLYKTGYDHIEAGVLLKRKKLTVGKKIFFIRVRFPENADIRDHKIINQATAPIEYKINQIIGTSTVSNGRRMSLANPGICVVNTQITSYVDNLFKRTELPFIEKIDQRLLLINYRIGQSIDIDQQIDVLEINDDPLNPVNKIQNFEPVNNLFHHLCEWEFNATIAQEFLQSIEEESKAQEELSKW